MNTGPFHPDTGADRIDAFIVRDHGDLRPFSRFTYDFLDLYDALVNLGDFQFEELLHKHGIRSRNDNLRISCSITVDFLDDCPNHVPFAVSISIDLLRSWENEFDFVMDDQDFPSSDLVDLTYYNLTDQLLVPFKDIFLLNVSNSLTECLPGRHNGAAAEVLEIDFLRNFIADTKVSIDPNSV